MNKKVLYLVHGAVIAALYVVLPYRDFSWDVSSAIP